VQSLKDGLRTQADTLVGLPTAAAILHLSMHTKSVIMHCMTTKCWKFSSCVCSCCRVGFEVAAHLVVKMVWRRKPLRELLRQG
jgi:hypothetical protein